MGFTPQEISMFFARYNIASEDTEEYNPENIRKALEDVDEMPDYFFPMGKDLDSGEIAYITESDGKLFGKFKW